jgi:hypothetical protein
MCYKAKKIGDHCGGCRKGIMVLSAVSVDNAPILQCDHCRKQVDAMSPLEIQQEQSQAGA